MGFVCSPFLLKNLSKNLDNVVREARRITKRMERLSSQKKGRRFGYFSQMKRKLKRGMTEVCKIMSDTEGLGRDLTLHHFLKYKN